MFQLINQAQRNQSNPMELLKQVTKNYNSDQLNDLFERAKQFGVPDDVVKQAKNGINIK